MKQDFDNMRCLHTTICIQHSRSQPVFYSMTAQARVGGLVGGGGICTGKKWAFKLEAYPPPLLPTTVLFPGNRVNTACAARTTARRNIHNRCGRTAFQLHWICPSYHLEPLRTIPVQ